MDMVVKIVLIVIILLIVVFSILLFFVVTIHHRKKWISSKVEEINNTYEPDQIKLFENEMRMVYHAAKSNPKLKSEYLRIDSMNTRIKGLAKVISPEIFSLSSTSNSVRYIEFKKRYDLLSKKINSFNELTNDFKSFIGIVTAQSDFLRTEFNSYQGILREVLDKYKKRRIILSSMSNIIDQKASSLMTIESRFFDATKSSQSQNAANILNVYIENITLLAEAIDMIPSLIAHVEQNIPKNIKTLDKLYRGIKKELGMSFEHISYSKLIKNISEEFKETKVLINDLKAKEASRKISTIYKSIKFIENMINIEVRAKNLYLLNYNVAIDEITNAMSRFVKLRDRIEKEKVEGKTLDPLIKNNLTDLKSSADILFELIKDHNDVSVNRQIPFSTKISRLKLMLNKTAIFINETNKISTLIWEMDAEKQKSYNKLMKVRDAMNKVLAEVSEKDILLSEKKREIANMINQEIDEQFDLLADEKSQVDKEKIKVILQKAVEFYKVVGGDIAVAEMASNMIRHVSAKRALDPELNTTMSTVLRYYESGDYDGSLTHIMNYFSERGR